MCNLKRGNKYARLTVVLKVRLSDFNFAVLKPRANDQIVKLVFHGSMLAVSSGQRKGLYGFLIQKLFNADLVLTLAHVRYRSALGQRALPTKNYASFSSSFAGCGRKCSKPASVTCAAKKSSANSMG